MKKNNLKRFLASLLAVLMLASVTGVSPAVFAEDAGSAPSQEETVNPELKESATPIEVLIKDSLSNEQVKVALANALLENADQVDVQSLNWTYTCAVKGTYKVGLFPTTETKNAREATVSVFGETRTVKNDTNTIRPYYDATYIYPALKDNADGVYTLYLNNQSVNIKKVAKLSSAINVVDTVPEIAIPYNADGSVNNAKLHETIFNTVVTGTTPEGLTYDKLNYSGNFSEGEQTITISYAGNDDYNGTSANVKVKFVDGRNVAFTAKEQPKTLSIGYVGNKIDVATTENNVRKQLVNQLADDVDLSKVKVEYKNAFRKYEELNKVAIETYSTGNIIKPDAATDIRLTYAGDATHKPFTAEIKDIQFADNRVASSIVLKENASITYNKEKGAMKQDIFDNAIDWEATKLPEGITKDDLTFECNTSLVPKITVWGDIDGKEYPNLDAGDAQKIRISFVGNSDFKPGEFEFTIKVAKAHVDVSMKKFATAYAGDEEALSKEALNVALDPNDPRIDIYMVFAGINTNFDGSVNLVLTDDQWKVIENISAAEREIYNFMSKTNPEYKNKPTLKDKLTDGITIGEFKQYVNDAVNALKVVAKIPGVDDILKKYNIDIDSIAAMVSIFTELDFADDTTIAFGVPKHAGMYRAYAIAVNKNYNTNYASGTVLILMNVKNVKIVMNEKFSSKMDAATAAEVAKAPASLQHNGVTVKDQSSLHYLYTGIQSNLKPYQSTTEFPTEPGRYVVTVVTLGGDYLAPPVTKTFQITK